MLLLTGCMPKDYTPPPRELPPSHYGETTVSAPPSAQTVAPPDSISSSTITPLKPVTAGGGEEDATKVALLLPLTGRNADLGRALEHAATLSLFDQYATLSPKRLGIKVTLLPIDTGDTEEQARAAAQQAVDAGAKLIIGPVFSDMVKAVTPIVVERDIPLISLSNNKTVAQPGVYIFGFSPEQQAARMMDYMTKSGQGRIAALVPDSAYGRAVLGAANHALRLNEASFLTIARYSSEGIGIDAAINQLVPEGAAPAFDALFLPEAGAALKTILHSLDGRTNERVRLLGTGLWDDYNLIRKVNLQGALLASSPPALTRAFEGRFSQTYHYTPPRIASLAYDAVALAVTLATSGRGFDNKVLTHPGGFSGPANGLFRFHQNGISERKLAIMLVEKAGFLVIDPAPVNFAPVANTPPSP